MKKKLETVRSALPYPTEIYSKTIDEKISTVAAAKESLTETLAYGFSLMDKVHDLSGSLTINNKLVYPL